MSASAIYSGPVFHKRARPRAHALRYRIFMLLLDLTELDDLFARLRWLRRGRVGLASFDTRDHGDHRGGDLRTYVAERLVEAGLEPGGPVRLLCMPRIFGYGFNPLSLYFCHGRDGRLNAILYEVRNTFGQDHGYMIAVPEEDGPLHQTAPKRFFVSPFMDMDLTYRFTVSPPSETIAVRVEVLDAGGVVLTAGFAGKRSPLTDAGLLSALVRHPLLSFGVVAAIHWEALKIFAKGVRLRPRPPAPAHLITHGEALRPGQ
ncbi:DUF1365 domain-containing protein [Caulobacter sp. 1776]|uniref:DUF1365 domain-containing protein n=1 Tax=Caulobacter sp. 1776 TaxID=3156420 RepID=UPI0033953836